MIAIDMPIPRFCAECRFMLAGTWKDGKEYPCICYAKKPAMLIKPSETDCVRSSTSVMTGSSQL